MEENLYKSILNYLKRGTYDEGVSKPEKRALRQKASQYVVILDKLHKVCCHVYLYRLYQVIYVI